ncbi:uncharacterized protein LOC142984122 isoform X2 [Anticarsia gemmatalis]|uniref:uncharacterized protein LOC142984122 isoform X2 n=1 Tax=Anticarsia gemmatalis TaxID=129554 RepID=UPI003F7780D4
MWVRLWLTFSVSAVCAQYTSTSEQQSRYTADSGHHEMMQTHGSFTLGHKLHELNNQKTKNVYEAQNTTQIQAPPPSAQPVDIYLLQQFTPYQSSPQQIPSPGPTNTYYTGTSADYTLKTEDSKPLPQEDFNEYRSPVRIFKDHNCSNPEEHVSKELETDLKKSKDLFAEVPSYDLHDINNFAASLPTPYTYRGEVKFRVESPRPNARTERFYITTIRTPLYEENTTQDGIDKLVASTQDLISNEDLLFINHAAEKHIHEQSEDIKPRSRYTVKSKDADGQDSKTHITVKAKIGNILSNNAQKNENDRSKQQILQSDGNKYDFATPIVVSESSYNNFREQIVDNLVSTMVPYMANGYQIVGVKDTLEENQTNKEQNTQDKDIVNVTPRPVNQNYLAPITVALRLINANDSEMFNTLDDHEAADSELISDTVKSPPRERTVVEVQKSIPVSITHINDVEVHEYLDLDEGRSNNKGGFEIAKSLYNKYVEAVKSSKKMQEDMSKLLYQYEEAKEENREKEQENDQDQLEPSENIRSQVQVNLNGEVNNQRSEHYYEDYNNDNAKIIQPIIIEKEVPITKFVDRYIEKKVPYPQHIEVQVPVDRPVPVPVHVEKIVEKPVEVTKYVDKPYPVEVPRPYPVEVQVPYPVEQKVYVDRPVHVPYPVEKVVEKQVLHPVPVPTPVAYPVEVPYPVEHKVLYPVPVDRPVPVTVEVEKPVEKIIHKEVPVPYTVEKKVPYPVHYETRVPVPYPVEKRVPYPVERIVEKPVTITKYVDKPIHIQVPVPQPVAVPVHVPRPYPVDRIVEKRVPYPVTVEKVVEKEVKVPYPVEKIVEKIVEKPVVVTKYIDKPYPVEKKVPYPVERIVEKKVPYPVQVPVEVKVPYPVEKYIDRPIHVPVPYAYSHSDVSSETRNVPQVQKEHKQKKVPNTQHLYLSQYYQLMKEKEKLKPMHSTQWGNQYASSYQYINNTSGESSESGESQEQKSLNKLANYLTYITNSPNRSNQYYGPVPPQYQDDWWQNNKNYVVEYKMRRADREPKVSNLRIEYGGFQPPLIPSTEVDLDGMPINKS